MVTRVGSIGQDGVQVPARGQGRTVSNGPIHRRIRLRYRCHEPEWSGRMQQLMPVVASLIRCSWMGTNELFSVPLACHEWSVIRSNAGWLRGPIQTAYVESVEAACFFRPTTGSGLILLNGHAE